MATVAGGVGHGRVEILIVVQLHPGGVQLGPLFDSGQVELDQAAGDIGAGRPHGKAPRGVKVAVGVRAAQDHRILAFGRRGLDDDGGINGDWIFPFGIREPLLVRYDGQGEVGSLLFDGLRHLVAPCLAVGRFGVGLAVRHEGFGHDKANLSVSLAHKGDGTVLLRFRFHAPPSSG